MHYVGIFLVAVLFMWPAVILLTLVLFRQKIKTNEVKLIICSILMAFVTLLVQSFQIQFMMTLLQPCAFMLCLFFVFRFNIFYSILMAVTSYMLAVIEEIVYFMLLSRFNWEVFIDITREHVIFPAIVVAIFNYFMSWFLYKMRFGFSFIPILKRIDPWHGKSKHKMKIILSIGITAVSCLCFMVYLWEKWIVINTLVVFLILILSYYFLYKRELEE